jgi:hypothetical protein
MSLLGVHAFLRHSAQADWLPASLPERTVRFEILRFSDEPPRLVGARFCAGHN